MFQNDLIWTNANVAWVNQLYEKSLLLLAIMVGDYPVHEQQYIVGGARSRRLGYKSDGPCQGGMGGFSVLQT